MRVAQPVRQQVRTCPPVVVHNRYLWIIVHVPPFLPEPVAQVNILIVHKKTFVEKANLLYGLPTEDHTSADDPIDLVDLSVIPVCHQITPDRTPDQPIEV